MARRPEEMAMTDPIISILCGSFAFSQWYGVILKEKNHE
jgi:hypothetical protein